MATHAADVRSGRLTELLELLAPFPGRLAFATRLAVICALTTLVVEIYQTPEPALTTYVVFFLNKPDRGTSLILNFALLMLISLIIVSLILIAMVVIDQPPLRVASMTAISLGLLFVASASKLRPIGGTVVLIIAYALDLLGAVQVGELATRALLYAWLFIGIPAGVSIGINLVLAPPPRRLAEQALAQRLRLAAGMLRDPDVPTRRAFMECLREGDEEVEKWLKLAAAGRTSTAADLTALRQAAGSTGEILVLVDTMDRDPDAAFPEPLRQRLAHMFDAMAAILADGGYPVEIECEAAADGEPPLPPRAAQVFARMREVIVSFAEISPCDEQPAKPAEKSGGFFLPDAFSNPGYGRYAVKTTAAAMFCYVLYTLLDWPGIHTCFITCYIVSLGTTAETVEKLALRILGALVGAAAGIAAIVYLTPQITSVGALMAVVFLAALASGWVAAGSPRIAYAGFQIAFAFFLCVIQGSAPAFDLTTARDRVIGILLGNLVVYVVFTNLWPVSVATRVNPAIAAALRRLSDLAMEPNRLARRALASRTWAAVGAIELDLGLARFEPRSVRPAEAWIDDRRRTAEEIIALCGPLLASPHQDPGFSASTARRLADLAAKYDPVHNGPPGTDDQIAAGRDGTRISSQQPFRDAVNRHLRDLEEVAARQDGESTEASYAPPA